MLSMASGIENPRPKACKSYPLFGLNSLAHTDHDEIYFT